MSGLFYRAFEDKYRGSRELIKSRLLNYLPFIGPLARIYYSSHALDLGCGRGEWLEVTGEVGFISQGVDLDDGMLSACRELGLSVKNDDAVSCLKELPDQSQALVSGFHIAEHLSFDTLQTLVAEALRVLLPGGLLILETPNPENLTVGATSFYLDPTHQRPLPPELLRFVVEFAGFSRTALVRQQEAPELLTKSDVSLFDVLAGVSPDYAVIGQKSGPQEILSDFDSAFDATYGLDLHNLTSRFSKHLTSKDETRLAMKDLETALLRAQQAERLALLRVEVALANVKQGKAEADLIESQRNNAINDLQTALRRAEQLAEVHEVLKARADGAYQQAARFEVKLSEMKLSTSWRLSAPLRAIKHLLGRRFGSALNELGVPFDRLEFLKSKLTRRSRSIKSDISAMLVSTDGDTLISTSDLSGDESQSQFSLGMTQVSELASIVQPSGQDDQERISPYEKEILLKLRALANRKQLAS